MDENKKDKQTDTKALCFKAIKIGLLAGLGYIAAGPLGALVGLILAMAK